MTQQHEAVVRVAGDPERVAVMSKWFGGQMTPVGDDRTRLRIGADALEWLASMIVILATSFDLTVEVAPPEVRRLVADAVRRLSAV